MAGEAAAAFLTIQAAQLLLQNVQTNFAFGSYLCPTDRTIDEITSFDSFDFIIVGAGTAGSVLANRLTIDPSISVLLLEEGGCPPLESDFPGTFPYLAESVYDNNFPTLNDNYSCQNMRDQSARITSGKMLGGSGSLNHMVHSRGDASKYNEWVKAANSSMWSLDALLPYFIKSETVHDLEILSKYGCDHGTHGEMKLKRQFNTENNLIFTAYSELGYEIRSDVNNRNTLGVVTPLLEIGETYRQGLAFITPIKDRTNLNVLTGATVTKVIFNDQNTATGVKFTYGGSSYEVNTAREVILSAGVIKSPQLLMVSGVGPADDLESFNISVIADLPVGQNLQDHTSAVSIYILRNSSLSSSSSVDLTKFPAPLTIHFGNLDDDIDYAEFQTINLPIPKANAGLMAICLYVIKYNEEICQKWYDANVNNDILFSLNTAYNMFSRGYMLLNSSDINDNPIISVGYLSNSNDLVRLGKYVANHAKILNTTAMENVGAAFFDMGLCSNETKGSTEFWECFVLKMSTPTWQQCGTNSMGSVVDSNLLVMNVTGLRVVDASVIPALPNSELVAPLVALAEKAADLILSSINSAY